MHAGLSLLNQVAFERVENAVAAGTTDQTSAGVAIDGFEVLTFLVLWGAITTSAVTSVKLQQSSDDGSTDVYSDIEGTNITVADDADNKMTIIEIVKPTKRYVRAYLDLGTQNAVIDGVVCLKSHCRGVIPLTQGSTVQGAETHVSPEEGTA